MSHGSMRHGQKPDGCWQCIMQCGGAINFWALGAPSGTLRCGTLRCAKLPFWICGWVTVYYSTTLMRLRLPVRSLRLRTSMQVSRRRSPRTSQLERRPSRWSLWRLLQRRVCRLCAGGAQLHNFSWRRGWPPGWWPPHCMRRAKSRESLLLRLHCRCVTQKETVLHAHVSCSS